MLRCNLTIVCVSFFLSMSAFASESNADEAAPAEGNKKPRLCKDALTRVGRPNTLDVVASLNAIRAWSEAARRLGEDYGTWHKAKAKSVSCEKKGSAGFYVCVASGKPCLNKLAAENSAPGSVPVGNDDPLSLNFGYESQF